MISSSIKFKLLRNIGANAYGQVVTVVIQLVSVPLFLHYWGAARYGEWIILSSIPAYLSLSDIGFASVAGNDMTMRVAKGDKRGALGVYQSIWVLIFIVSAVIAVVFGPLIFYFPIYRIFSITHVSANGAASVLFVLMLYVLVGLQGNVLSAGFRSIGHYAYGTVLNNTQRLAEWLVSMVALISGGGFFSIAASTLAIRVLGTLAIGILLRSRADWMRLGFRYAAMSQIKALFRPATAFMAFPLGLAISIQGTVLVIGMLLGPAAVATFSAYRTLTRLLVQAITMLNQAVWPEISAAYGMGNVDLVTRLHRKGSSITFWVSFVSVVVLGIAGESMIEIWTRHAFEPNPVFLVLLLTAAFLNVLWQTSWVALMATNKHQMISVSFVLTVTVGIVATSLLIRFSGLEGAGFGLIVAELPMLYIAVNSSLKMLGDRWSTYARAVIGNPFKTENAGP